MMSKVYHGGISSSMGLLSFKKERPSDWGAVLLFFKILSWVEPIAYSDNDNILKKGEQYSAS